MSSDEQKVYSVFQNETLHIDEIYDKSNLELSTIYELLFTLEIKEKIKQLPGGFYLKVN